VARGILGKETLTPLEALGMDASTGNASTLDDLEAGLARLGHLADDLASTWTRTSEHSTYVSILFCVCGWETTLPCTSEWSFLAS
jgi:hypothetical protein